MRAVWEDPDTAPIDAKLRAALKFIAAMTRQPEKLGPADVEPLRSAGISDRAIEDAIQICAAFNMVTRIADALEFEVPPWETALRHAKMLLRRGYLM